MNMTRKEKIDILIEGRLWEWVYAHCLDGLEEALLTGFKGYENCTDEELDDSLEEIEHNIEEIKQMLAKKNKND